MKVVGYRCWVYCKKSRQLMSPMSGTNWSPGIVKTHVRPWLNIDLHTQAGIYASKSYDDLVACMLTDDGKKFLRESWWEGPQAEFLPTALVFGTVELWGKVVEHTKGWRGEHAIVQSLISFSIGPQFKNVIHHGLNVMRLMYCPLGEKSVHANW